MDSILPSDFFSDLANVEFDRLSRKCKKKHVAVAVSTDKRGRLVFESPYTRYRMNPISGKAVAHNKYIKGARRAVIIRHASVPAMVLAVWRAVQREAKIMAKI